MTRRRPRAVPRAGAPGPLTVRQVTVWRREVENHPGALAGVLAPLAAVGARPGLVMGYRAPGRRTHAVLEVAPVTGRRSVGAAIGSGMQEAPLPSLLAAGDDRDGLVEQISRALGEAGLDLAFLVWQRAGPRFSALLGFDEGTDLKRAATVIRRAARSVVSR